MGLITSGCTQGVKDYYAETQQDAAGFNYYRIVQALELEKVFPGPQEKTKNALKNNCLTGGEARVTTYSGVADEVRYTQCEYTPYPLPESPQRLKNR